MSKTVDDLVNKFRDLKEKHNIEVSDDEPKETLPDDVIKDFASEIQPIYQEIEEVSFIGRNKWKTIRMLFIVQNFLLTFSQAKADWEKWHMTCNIHYFCKSI